MKFYKYHFTLLELLIVIAIIGLLLTLLLPSLMSARERSRRAVCLSNLAQSHRANALYGNNHNLDWPPGNAVLDRAQGVNSVYRIATKTAFGMAIPYHTGYLNSPELFYCPSWTHPYMQMNKISDTGLWGGYTSLPTYPQPLRHYMTSYSYRGMFQKETRAPSLRKDEADVPYMGDHWAKSLGNYVHNRDGYNILYIGGHAKFIYDKKQIAIKMNFHTKNWSNQDAYWDLLYKK